MSYVAGSSPDVAIVVVSYQVRDLLRACLRSIEASLARSPGLRAEVWVVDNASSDGSATMVAAEFPAARLIANQDNPGFSAANNQAIERTTARHILLLNPDTEVQGDAIEHLVRFLDAHPDTGAAGCQLTYSDGSFQHGSYELPGLAQVILDLHPIHHRLLESRLNGRYARGDFDRVRDVGHPLGACLIVRRKSIDEVGALDERYYMYCEELDLCMRLHRAGWRVRHTPGATVVHHGGRSTDQFRGRMLIAKHRSRLQFFDRFYSRWFTRVVRLILRQHYGRALRRIESAADHDPLAAREQIATYRELISL